MFYWLIVIAAMSIEISPRPNFGQRWTGQPRQPRKEFVQYVKDQEAKRMEDQKETNDIFDIMWWSRR